VGVEARAGCPTQMEKGWEIYALYSYK